MRQVPCRVGDRGFDVRHWLVVIEGDQAVQDGVSVGEPLALVVENVSAEHLPRLVCYELGEDAGARHRGQKTVSGCDRVAGRFRRFPPWCVRVVGLAFTLRHCGSPLLQMNFFQMAGPAP
ncbi:MAG: hypothetical protein KAH46_22290, partial [Mycobacterium sp.]|nr:hypothetical protein [Mycobacterium sp.]